MKRSLDELVEMARAESVPWSSERFDRVERRILRARFRPRAGWAELALCGLASATLCASFVLVARAVRPASAPEHGVAFGELSEPSPTALDRPVGDGGQTDDVP